MFWLLLLALFFFPPFENPRHQPDDGGTTIQATPRGETPERDDGSRLCDIRPLHPRCQSDD